MQILNHQGDEPDYMLCVNDDNSINSRWYVVEGVRLLTGQYRYELLRDVIADYYDQILTAPMFVEKALLPVESPFIHNKENMSFNQKKTTECLLKDYLQCRWLVGYVDNKAGNDSVSGVFVQGNTSDSDAQTISDELFNIINSGKEYYINDRNFIPILEFGNEIYYMSGGSIAWDWSRSNVNIGIRYNYSVPDSYNKYEEVNHGISFFTYAPDFISCKITGDTNSIWPKANAALNLISDNKNSALVSSVQTAISQMGINIISESNYNLINNLVDSGTKIKRGGSTYIVRRKIDRINDNPQSTKYEYKNNITEAKNIINIFNNALLQSGVNSVMTDDTDLNNTIINNTINGNAEFPGINPMNVHLSQNAKIVQFELEEIGGSKYRFTIAGTSGRVRNDSGLYDMFAIPYDPVQYYVQRGGDTALIDTGKTSTKISIETANNIALKLVDKLYDLQILPYCPCPEYFTNKDLDFRGNDKVGNGYYNTVRLQTGDTESDATDRIVGLILWCRSSKRHFELNPGSAEIPINIRNSYTKPLNKKVDSLTKMCRICSPGYTSIFEINPAMNDGISSFIVDILYQPYNPFIRIAPLFKSLYGIYTQYDAKGLILKGDYSIPRMINRWEEYQINNKTYNEIYDREVQNLQLTQSIERKQQIWQIAANTVSAATQGATAGGMAGGGLGSAVGGVAAGGMSLTAGLADLKYADILRGEALDYKEDMFGYALANIQALPQTLTKSSPLSDNNPIWPIFEIYEATPSEKSALINKIKYNSMSVGVIGTLNEYLPNIQYYRSDGFDKMYFKGVLVRLDSIYGDTHIINAISNELNRGIYL